MNANNSIRRTDPDNLAVRPIFAPTSPLEHARTKKSSCKCFRIRSHKSLDLIWPEMNTYTKQGGVPPCFPLFHRIVNSNTGSAGTTPFVPSKSSVVQRRSNSSGAGNLMERSSSGTNHVHEYARLQGQGCSDRMSRELQHAGS